MEYVLVDPTNEVVIHLSPDAFVVRTGSLSQASDMGANWSATAPEIEDIPVEWTVPN